MNATEASEEQPVEVFREAWKLCKRNANEIGDYVRGKQENHSAIENKFVIDFDDLDNSPHELTSLVRQVDDIETSKEGVDDPEGLLSINVDKVYKIQGRPGFLFIPNPFKSVDQELYWTVKFALDYISSPLTRRNIGGDEREQGALEDGLRWATLGFHYNWRNRSYSLEDRTEFPQDLAKFSENICASVGQEIVPETAIINFYRKGKTMGGHKDDAEWTDEASIVSISSGNTGVYVLGGDSQTDNGPPQPIPLLVRSGDIVLLGGPSRMNIHGVPCMLKNTFPRRLEEAILLNRKGYINPNLASPSTLLEFLKTTRINVNVRQVQKVIRKLL